MVRKRKASDDASVHAHATPPAENNSSNNNNKCAIIKKQKIDWSTLENFDGFTISSVGLNTPKQASKLGGKKSKRNYGGAYPSQDAPLDADVVQPNPFPDTDLSEVHVKIAPAIYWESTSRYRKFTINNEEFSVGQVVFVKKVEDEQDAPDAIQHWLAKVLEVRAGDASHVYLRVFWAYRPEDLPGGRQPHHGSCELIISNHMDIIEALTVQASASVIYWNDDPDDLALPADQLFYRQSFDITKKTRPLSKLNTFCVDKQPCNPDKLLVQCPHCSNWLHAECLEKDAVQTVLNLQHNTQMPPPKKRGRPSKPTQADVKLFEAKVHSSETGKTRLTITDNRQGQNKRQWDVDIPCLMCGEIIEEAEPEPKPEEEAAENADADDANTTPSLAPGEANFVIRDSDADDTTTTTTITTTTTTKLPAPELPPLASIPIETKVQRGRGRPPGSKNKKRKRSSYPFASSSPIKKKRKTTLYSSRGSNVEVEEEVEGEGELGGEEAGPRIVVQDNTETVLDAPRENATPAATATLPAAVQESVFQSGIRSVKRLLWRT